MRVETQHTDIICQTSLSSSNKRHESPFAGEHADVLPRLHDCRFNKIRIELEQCFDAGAETKGDFRERFFNLSGKDRPYEYFGAVCITLNIADILQH